MFHYLLFGGQNYYALGGAHDLIDDFASIDDASVEGSAMLSEGGIDWWHVYDTVSKQIVARSSNQAYGVYD